jgi:hypothetical protein
LSEIRWATNPEHGFSRCQSEGQAKAEEIFSVHPHPVELLCSAGLIDLQIEARAPLGYIGYRHPVALAREFVGRRDEGATVRWIKGTVAAIGCND